MTRKYCAAFPCSNLAVDGAYCVEHRPARAPKETNPFYLSVRWRRFREWYLGKYPLCEQCLLDGRPDTAAVMVDHIVEIEDGGALTEEENSQSLCWKCHGIKTAQAKNHRIGTRDNRCGSEKET
ncbi:MAG: HNH endonuclease signature motif containing protein [Deltaproteobacteria bacterium]